ncbi:DUF2868 domain-containing protein [Desulfobotulus sp. H1]|uniref:DUF2868 domain-containing protein n=1 Tax=Desulfobotulus pelophilus TaxID=2823377 RepID=A0ABT3N872_9BACT|nr:DUF2868 domain-containing protein [Desulfobotulus pelophilus]MCW7753654.1 DUF2868 domain-containing protein [Desulfobotulus pelophilus]
MKQHHTIASLVDTEWFLELDAGSREADLRNQRIAAFISPEMTDGECLTIWLDHRRREAGSEAGRPMPGVRVLAALRLAIALLGIAGFLTGFFMALATLRYDGITPVNLLYALTVFVALPLLTVIFSLGLVLFRKKKLPVTYKLFFSVLQWLFSRMLLGTEKRIPSHARDFLKSRNSRIQELYARYQPLIFSLAFYAFQMAGLFFVFGLFSGFLIKVVGSDLAFAWQSTLNLPPETFSRMVRMVSAPWSILLPHTLPDPAQIEGSRIILKDGIGGLTHDHLTSWWTFLSMALLVYGLLPRLFLFLLARKLFHRRIDQVEVVDSRVHNLCFFLRREALFTASPERGSGLSASVCPVSHVESVPIREWELWINDEIPESLHGLILEETSGVMGCKPENCLFINLETLHEKTAYSDRPRVLAMEVFMPPVHEDVQILKKAAEAIRGPLWIWPVGRVDRKGGRAEKTDILIWSRRLEGLREPRPIMQLETSHDIG